MRKRHNQFLLLAIGCCLSLLGGCRFNSLVEEKFAVSDAKWEMNEVFTTTFKVTDTVSAYDFFLNVRNAGDYPYSNLHVFVVTTFPNGKKAIDTVDCILADKNGKWLGKGLGDILDNRIKYHDHLRFPMSGEYKVEIQHAMRDEVVPLILNVGISIEKVN